MFKFREGTDFCWYFPLEIVPMEIEVLEIQTFCQIDQKCTLKGVVSKHEHS